MGIKVDAEFGLIVIKAEWEVDKDNNLQPISRIAKYNKEGKTETIGRVCKIIYN